MTAPAAPAQPPERDTTAHRRVRRAVYAAFAALALLAVLLAVYAQRFEQARAADADIIRLAANQRAFTHEVGRLAALASAPDAAGRVPPDALAMALDRSRSDALLIEALVAQQHRLSGGAPPAVEEAMAGWQSARERLWYRAELLLRDLDPAGHTPTEAAWAVEREMATAIAAADALTDQLQLAARERSGGQLVLLRAGAALTLLVLGLLALFVVEPAARAVGRQVDRLADQTAELERLALVAERTDNVVVVTGADGRVAWVNQAFERRSGWPAAEARGLDPRDLLHRELNDPATMRALRHAVARGGGTRAELAHRARDGTEYWLDVDVRPLFDGQGVVRGHVMVGSDVTERRRLQQQLARSARIDSLTGLPNRAVVVERVQRALDHAERHPGYGFAVLFMDFDRFKQVNDTLGHNAGDELLRQVARRIEEALRPGDAVARVASQLPTAARIGGDEFVVVLEGVRDEIDARHVAERLLASLALPYTLGSHVVQSSASIGIVVAEHARRSAEEVLRDADTAMYEAKRAGRGRCVVFDGSMHDRVVQALEIESDLRRALREGELFVVYQPVVDLADSRMAGVEALVRWRHPTQGIVPPVKFIGIAEEAGLIDAIGQQVLEAACAQFARWRQALGERAPRMLAVNLSRAQLQLPGLVPEVKWLLEQNGMRPAELQLEVTESLAAQDERVQHTLRELKALGVKLALDDFGTGYSSLACLHQLPVDTVKVDRSFVTHAETVEYHRVLIEATIRVANALGMTTVAEGIESSGQAALMRRLRCDRGQGWLYSRPLLAEELVAWIDEQQPRSQPHSGDSEASEGVNEPSAPALGSFTPT